MMLYRLICRIPMMGIVGKINSRLFPLLFRNYQTWYYRKIGIEILGLPRFISSDVYFDSSDYSIIKIGEGVTISKEVCFLTHDYSIANALSLIDLKAMGGGTPCFLKGICIGRNSFIGARVTILPGSTVGENCIIGAGSVIRGEIPDDSIVIGNPCKIIGSVVSFAKKHEQKQDYIFR